VPVPAFVERMVKEISDSTRHHQNAPRRSSAKTPAAC